MPTYNLETPSSNMTCRICFEPCTEETKCKCVGFVHKECQERWINVSGRLDCEVCKTPFEDETVYECRPTMGDQRCYFGPRHTATVIFIIMFILNATYAMSLMIAPKWVYGVGLAFAMQIVLISMFINEPVRPEDIALAWKWSNFMVLTSVYSIVHELPMTVSVEDQEWRTRLVEIDAMLLCFVFVVRVFCAMLRGMRVRRLTTSRDRSDTTSGT